MSRLTASDLFNPTFSNPFLRRPETNPLLPTLDPAEEQSYLSSAAENGLGGLAYLGKLADKTFGGRAIRGVLGGQPRELLSILPFSDTAGLTDPSQTVFGRDLLNRAGIIGPDDPTSFGWDDAAGIAAEIALDPATYLGFGPLTRAGTLAKQTASLTPDLASTASRIGGFGVRESDLLRISPDAAEARRIAGLDPTTSVLPRALETRAAAEGVTINPRYSLDFGPTGYAGRTEQTATPLAGALGIGLPFSERLPFLTGRTGQQVATYLPLAVTGVPKAIDYAIDRTTGFSPLRAAGALFDPAAKGMYSGQAQQLARTFISPNEEAKRTAAMTEYAARYLDLKPFLDRGGDATSAAMRIARESAENVARQSPDAAAFAAQHFQSDEITRIREIGNLMGQNLRGPGVARAELDLGAESPELLDNAIEYFTRQKVVLPRQAGESLFSYATRYVREYGARHQSQIARDPIFKNVPGGTVQINEWARDPRLSGSASWSKNTPLQARAHILDELTGGAFSAGAPVSPEVLKQADGLVHWLGSLSDDYSKKGVGFFSEDLPADYLARLNRSAVAQSAAESTYEGITRLARPMSPSDPDLVPIDQVLKSAALTGKDMTGMPIGYDILARKLGVNPNDLAGMGIPRDVATDMQRLNQAWINPGEMLPILAAWDGVANLFKTYLTAPFVSFHTRNGLSALFNMWRGEAFSPAAMSDAWNVSRGHQLTKPLPGMTGSTPAEWTRQLFEELMGTGTAYVARPTNTSDIIGTGGQVVVRQPNLPMDSGRGLIGDVVAGIKGAVPKTWEQANPLNVQGVNRGEDVNSVIKTFRAAGQQIEDWSRVSHYIAKRQQGFNPVAAAMEVKKYQLDYSYLTQFERQVMKRGLPWYCVPTDHEILTRSGWKFHSQLEVGEEVMGYDHQTGELKWTPLIEVCEFDYDGDLMVFECRGAKVMFTHNHRWPVEMAKTFVKGRHYGGERLMMESHELNTMSKIPLTGDYGGGDSILSPRLAAILGWVVTDGYMRWRGNHCEMVVYQTENKFLQEVRDLLGVEPRKATDDRRPENRVFTFGVKRDDVVAITAHIQGLGQLAEVAAKLSREAAEAMYVAMMQAEGCKSETGQEHFAQSPKGVHVRDAFQIICVLTGRSAFQSSNGCYIRRTDHIWPKHWKRPDEKYVGKIWCPRTATGTWIMRHKGMVCITGNTFSRRNLPPMLDDLAKNPSKITATLRGVTRGRTPYEYIPEYVAEGTSVPIPGAEEGSQRYIRSFGLPFEDEAIKTLGSFAQGDITRGAQQVLGMSQPALRAPLEFTFGTQLYSGRPLTDLRPSATVDAVTSALGGDVAQARKLTELLSATPLSRVVTTADRIIDDRKPIWQRGVNVTTGVQIGDAEIDQQRDAAYKRMLDELLTGRPGVRQQAGIYLSKPLLAEGRIDPETLALYRMYLNADRRVRDMPK